MVQSLIDGFEKFRKEEYESLKASMPRLVKEGQSPDHFVISCIDSRSNPGTIFRSAPGTFMAHKAMGAIVRPYSKGTALAAALQFALIHNKVQNIIILGHTGCGAIEALINGIEDEEISSFLDVAQAAMEKAQQQVQLPAKYDDLRRFAEQQIILESAKNLRTYPSVQQALAENRLAIKPWLFDMKTGDLLEHDPNKNTFEKITVKKRAAA
jgi:carbonic anhydrase